jgi:putative transposase
MHSPPIILLIGLMTILLIRDLSAQVVLFDFDNGPEFISKDLDRWAYWNHVKLDFSGPGTPSGNALVEAFNSRLRQECLNEHWYLLVEDALEKITAWQIDYNTERPHSALGHRSPSEIKPENQRPKAAAA